MNIKTLMRMSSYFLSTLPKHLIMTYFPIGILKEKRCSESLLPERKKELDELAKNIKEDDNPVVVVVTLK